MGDFYLADKRNVIRVGTNVIDENYKLNTMIIVDEISYVAGGYSIKLPASSDTTDTREGDTVVINSGDDVAYFTVLSISSDSTYTTIAVELFNSYNGYSAFDVDYVNNQTEVAYANVSRIERELFLYNDKLHRLGNTIKTFKANKYHKNGDIVATYLPHSQKFKFFKCLKDDGLFSGRFEYTHIDESICTRQTTSTVLTVISNGKEKRYDYYKNSDVVHTNDPTSRARYGDGDTCGGSDNFSSCGSN
jgi:hypothetical protein